MSSREKSHQQASRPGSLVLENFLKRQVGMSSQDWPLDKRQSNNREIAPKSSKCELKNGKTDYRNFKSDEQESSAKHRTCVFTDASHTDDRSSRQIPSRPNKSIETNVAHERNRVNVENESRKLVKHSRRKKRREQKRQISQNPSVAIAETESQSKPQEHIESFTLEQESVHGDASEDMLLPEEVHIEELNHLFKTCSMGGSMARLDICSQILPHSSRTIDEGKSHKKSRTSWMKQSILQKQHQSNEGSTSDIAAFGTNIGDNKTEWYTGQRGTPQSQVNRTRSDTECLTTVPSSSSYPSQYPTLPSLSSTEVWKNCMDSTAGSLRNWTAAMIPTSRNEQSKTGGAPNAMSINSLVAPSRVESRPNFMNKKSVHPSRMRKTSYLKTSIKMQNAEFESENAISSFTRTHVHAFQRAWRRLCTWPPGYTPQVLYAREPDFKCVSSSVQRRIRSTGLTKIPLQIDNHNIVYQDSPFTIEVVGIFLTNLDKILNPLKSIFPERWRMKSRQYGVLYSICIDDVSNFQLHSPVPKLHCNFRNGTHQKIPQGYIPVDRNRGDVMKSDGVGLFQRISLRFVFLQYRQKRANMRTFSPSASAALERTLGSLDALKATLQKNIISDKSESNSTSFVDMCKSLEADMLINTDLSEEIISSNIDFALASRSTDQNPRGELYLRYGYCFFLSEACNLRLYTQLDTAEQIPLMARRMNGTLCSQSPPNLSYIVIRVAEIPPSNKIPMKAAQVRRHNI